MNVKIKNPISNIHILILVLIMLFASLAMISSLDAAGNVTIDSTNTSGIKGGYKRF